MKWIKDDRLFSRRERWVLAGDLWSNAKDVLLHAKVANARRSDGSDEERMMRERHFRLALDALVKMEILLMIKYDMILRGFDAINTSKPKEEPRAEPKIVKKRERKLTQDDIDRIFERFENFISDERDLIRGVLNSDARRRRVR